MCSYKLIATPIANPGELILYKEFTMMIYKVCTNIKMTCTHNISKLKKILKIQMCYPVRKSLRMPKI
jgi:hypothetical protein